MSSNTLLRPNATPPYMNPEDVPIPPTREELAQRRLNKAVHADGQARSAGPVVMPPQISIEPSPDNDSPYKFEPFLGLSDLVDVWYLMRPDTKLYPWQYQTLLLLSGYIDGTRKGPRVHWTPAAPLIASFVACNDSGKDMTIISTLAIGGPLLYKDTRVVITSSSHDQLKRQTEAHIRHGISNINAYFGTKVFDSIDLHHRMPERGGEIALFATDEPGRAEGWHPLTKGGRLILIKNEAKTIPENISDALLRCHGYSHFLEISSPGRRNGTFFRNWTEATKYPDRPQPFMPWGRRITYRDCPHIPEETAALVRRLRGPNSFLYQTSFEANFHEEETDVAIPYHTIEQMFGIQLKPNWKDIGIGLDSSGGGDETTLWVRAGSAILRKLFFREKNTIVAAQRVHDFIKDLQNEQYRLRVDDGGISRTFTDQLERLGWRVERVLNQSRALKPARFANRAAELMWHVRQLYERRQIEAPGDEKTVTQLTTRKFKESDKGVITLESKQDMRLHGIESPDRADGFVLCFSTFWADRDMRPAGIDDADTPANPYSMESFLAAARTDPFLLERLKLQQAPKSIKGPELYTQQRLNRI